MMYEAKGDMDSGTETDGAVVQGCIALPTKCKKNTLYPFLLKKIIKFKKKKLEKLENYLAN